MDTAQLNETVKELMKLQQTKAWKIIADDFTGYAKDLQDEINTIGDNEKLFTRKDLKIVEMKLIKSLIEHPEQYYNEARQRISKVSREQEDPFKYKDEPVED